MPIKFRICGSRVLVWVMLCTLMLAWQDGLLADVPVRQVHIGVLAKRGTQITLDRWMPTADYLSRVIPGYRFTIRPLTFEEIPHVLASKEIDFLLANSAIYVNSEHDFHVFRIATLINRSTEHPLDRFGGVIFTRRDNSQINNLKDLRHHRLAAVNATSFGGYLMAWRELQAQDIDIHDDLSVSFFGTHDAVVRAVLERRADAGTVRTDTLERMAAAGSIELNQIKLLNPQNNNNFPFLLSTRLYPEWPMAALPHAPNDLVKSVSRALLAMPADDPAAITSKTFGWTVPANYQPVHELFAALDLPPHKSQHPTLLAWIQYHPVAAALSCLSLIVVLVAVIYLSKLNRRLTRSQDHLAKSIQAQKNIAAELKKNLAYLKESEEKMASLTESAFDAIIMLDPQGRVTFWNHAAERIFGYAIDAAIGMELDQWLSPEPGDQSASYLIQRYISNRESPLPGTTLEVTALRKDGKTFAAEIALSSVLLKHGWHVTCVLRNITHRKQLMAARRQLETELTQHHKMQALAHLSGGLAHEINTPLQAITSNLKFLQDAFGDFHQLQLIQDQLTAEASQIASLSKCVDACDMAREELDLEFLSDEVGQALQQSHDSTEQIKGIVRSMCIFTHPDSQAKQTTDLNKLIRDLIAISQNLWSHCAELHLDLWEPELLVDCFPGELSQALFNLLINATQAIEEKYEGTCGHIYITSRCRDHQAIIEIRDDGAGIPVAAREHIFNPFFTTRDVGQGSGQGLTLSHDVVVRRHQGSLAFDTELGKGTIFTITLPLNNHAETEQDPGEEERSYKRGLNGINEV